MPIINFEGPELNREQKKQLAVNFTKVAHEVLPQIPESAFIVVLQESHPDNVAVGGKLLSES